MGSALAWACTHFGKALSAALVAATFVNWHQVSYHVRSRQSGAQRKPGYTPRKTRRRRRGS